MNLNLKKKLMLLSAIFVLGTVSYGEDTGPITVEMPSIKDWGIWHTASTGVIQGLNDTETAINNHANFIKNNIEKNKELENKIATESDNLSSFKSSVEENFTATGGALKKLELQANGNSQKISDAQALIANEQTAREQSEKDINSKISKNENSIQNEINSRNESEKQINSKIDSNTSAISNNSSLIEKETNDRINNEKDINNKISKNESSIQNEINSRNESEKQINSKVDTNKNNIQSEIQNREQSDKNIHSKIDANSKKITANTENIKKIETLHEKSTLNENKLQEHDKQLAAYEEQLMKNRAELDNINDKIANLDNKLSRGMSLMAAMSAIDFQDVKPGEVGIGAGVGHFENSQGVALGVAYAPTENFRVNAKYSVSTDSIKTSAIGVGGTFKFKVR